MIKTMMSAVAVRTADGTCPLYLHRPVEHGAWPAIILYMDAPGIRPPLHEIAGRLAGAGYVVGLPDIFYRGGPYSAIDPAIVWTNPALKDAHRERYVKTATPAAVMSDTAAIIETLEATPEVVASAGMGVVGYCMGGKLALIAAATFPGRVAVAASYHAGGLASDAPSSPHLLAPSIKAKVYVAGAIDDPKFPDDMKTRLGQALTDAGVDHRIETYPARHGWVPRDNACARSDRSRASLGYAHPPAWRRSEVSPLT